MALSPKTCFKKNQLDHDVFVSLGNGSLTQSGKHKQILIVPKHVGVLKEGDPLDGQNKWSRQINLNLEFLGLPMTS